MNTSYYASKLLNSSMDLVSISNSMPKFFMDKFPKTRIYTPLFPNWGIIDAYKKKIITDNEFTTLYYRHILNKLNPDKVMRELGEKAVLVCWEKIGVFCHRHLVAEWLKSEIGLVITELKEKQLSLWDKK